MTVITVLALVTLGGSTQIGSFQFYVDLPKVAKANKEGNIATQYRRCYRTKLCQWKYVLIIEIGLENVRFVVLVYYFPHLNIKNPADYGPQQHKRLFIKV